MIDGYRLEKLCKKYNISLEKIINKNSLVLSRGNFDEIDEILNYLINDLGISPKNIEKCPSILYKNIDLQMPIQLQNKFCFLIFPKVTQIHLHLLFLLK